MPQLLLLGPTKLRGRKDRREDALVRGAKRLGLLAYLVLARPRGFRRRDHILPLFWPAHGQKSARNALSNMLYHIRQLMGEEVIINRGSQEIGISHEKLWCDALAFDDALRRADTHEAVELYRGDLLEGFHVPDASHEFNQWLDVERSRFRRKYLNALETLGEYYMKEGQSSAALKWWRKRAEADPYDSRAIIKLMRALEGEGNRAEALRIARVHSRLLDEEYGTDPSVELQKFVQQLKERGELAVSTEDVSGDLEALDPCAIAVLPFEEVSTGEDAAAFAAGLHHDLLTRLSRINALTVKSRTSVLRYWNAEVSIPQIARELGVGTILEGNVQGGGDRVRLNVQLIDARNDAHGWAETYERELTSETLFDVQRELAEKITHGLRAKLLP